MKHITIILAFLMTLSSPVVGQDFDKGWAAYKAQDYDAALKEFLPLGNKGDATSQNKLGYMYMLGYGVPQDDKEAFKWFMKAAKQEVSKSMGQLGVMYKNGNPVPQDYVLAHMWFNIAAALGETDAYRGLMEFDTTPAAIQEAQAMARKCMESDYKECGTY